MSIKISSLSQALDGKKHTHASKLGVKPQFIYDFPSKSLISHIRLMEQILKKIIPENILSREKEAIAAWLKQALPLIRWSESFTPPDCLSLFLLCRGSKVLKTQSFFLDIVKKWLIPEKEINVLSFQHLHFHFDWLPHESFFVAELQLLIEDGQDLMTIKKNLPILAKEIGLGCQFSNYAEYILETKALSNDLKTTLSHEELVRMLQQFPNDFDRSLFTEMGRFLALSSREFIAQRSHRHITRLVCSQHLIHKKISRVARLFPEERHLYLRLVPARLQFLFGTKSVLGLIIGVCLFDKYEFFDDKHILLAVQKLIANTEAVKGSFYSHQSVQDKVRMLYLEVEKKDGGKFSLQEVKILKQQLIEELKAHVEKLIPAIFMIRNEEEVMKSILILSQELKYFSDLPQVMVSLEYQTATELVFTIILVRVLKKQDDPLELYFKSLSGRLQFTLDRIQTVGYLRKKYPKEANVFRLKIGKTPSLLRADSSLNFYLARQKVIAIIHEAVGEVRDYNGGMILQQGEQFSQFKQAFSKSSLRNQDLLENFFYSLSPIEMQATLSQEHLQTLFSMFLEAAESSLPKKESYFLKIDKQSAQVFVIIRARDLSFKEILAHYLNTVNIVAKSLTSTGVPFQGSYLAGYIYECTDRAQQDDFVKAIEGTIKEWLSNLEKLQVLRLSFLSLPTSLDPRIGGDEESATLLKMLFEGLMKMGKEGTPIHAIAESVHISDDLKQYTFHLRESFWSNGTRLIAYDFEYAWKKVLSPDFSTPFAYLFYPIKNAKLAKEGNATLDYVGVKALDDMTLRVELEHPTSYFLELTAHPLYSPVHHAVDHIHPNWSEQEGKEYISNGPFQLAKRHFAQGFELIKNSLYWDTSAPRVDQVVITQNNAYVASQMFKNDEIDWLGKPLRPWDPAFATQDAEKVESYYMPRVFWYVFNVKRFPFNHPKLRKALAYAINRKELIAFLAYNGSPATTPMPLVHTQHPTGFPDGQVTQAQVLFQEALQELGLTRKNFPVISLIHAMGETRDKTAYFLKQTWQEVFDINCKIESHEWRVVFDKLTLGDFQMGAMNWSSWINDPIYTFNAFKYGNDKINFAKWENPEYVWLLNAAEHAIHSERLKYLAFAEAILIEEMPVIPLFHEMLQFMKKSHVQMYIDPKTGSVDFKSMSISKK